MQKLIGLYSKAVEFYNGKNDGKYLYYQEKIHNLISRPEVLAKLSQKVGEPHLDEQTLKAQAEEEAEKKKSERAELLTTHF